MARYVPLYGYISIDGRESSLLFVSERPITLNGDIVPSIRKEMVLPYTKEEFAGFVWEMIKAGEYNLSFDRLRDMLYAIQELDDDMQRREIHRSGR